jgi:hypothetical protein
VRPATCRSRLRRLTLRTADRWLWVWLSRVWTAWGTALVIVNRTPSWAGTAAASDCSGREEPSTHRSTARFSRRARPDSDDVADEPALRRRVVHMAVSDHPTATWTGQQLRESFPWEQAPRFHVRDRDHAFDAWPDRVLAKDSRFSPTHGRPPGIGPFPSSWLDCQAVRVGRQQLHEWIGSGHPRNGEQRDPRAGLAVHGLDHLVRDDRVARQRRMPAIE